MIKFVFGIVVGIVLSTIGVTGVANILQKSAPMVDTSVNHVKQLAKENVK